MDGNNAVYDPVKFPHRELTERVIGCFYDVYNELGFGFCESVYHQVMKLALEAAGLKVESEVKLPVCFRGTQVGYFEADLLVEGVVILEFKAAERLLSAHESQLLNYLKATAIELGLLMNFGPEPKLRRLAFAKDRKRSRPPITVV
jgi:GxxExxY protein